MEGLGPTKVVFCRFHEQDRETRGWILRYEITQSRKSHASSRIWAFSMNRFPASIFPLIAMPQAAGQE